MPVTQSQDVPPIVHEVLRSSGQPLDASTRAFMEPRFGHDFSRVRVHTDARAAESAREVNALAYTVGRDVVFGKGQYALATGAGKQLLAHELVHTIQQDGVNDAPDMRLQRNGDKAPEIPSVPGAPTPITCPTFISMSAQVTSPTVNMNRGCRIGLGYCPTPRGQCGSSGTSGAIITATVQAPSGCTGELAFMQNVLATDRQRTVGSGTQECVRATTPHLDGVIPWKGCILSVTGSGRYTITTDDCPSINLREQNPRMTAASVNESFKTFLLWKQTGASERTAIANVTWAWRGATSRQEGRTCTSRWTTPTGSRPANRTGHASRDRPVTRPHIRDLGWGSCT